MAPFITPGAAFSTHSAHRSPAQERRSRSVQRVLQRLARLERHPGRGADGDALAGARVPTLAGRPLGPGEPAESGDGNIFAARASAIDANTTPTAASAACFVMPVSPATRSTISVFLTRSLPWLPGRCRAWPAIRHRPVLPRSDCPHRRLSRPIPNRKVPPGQSHACLHRAVPPPSPSARLSPPRVRVSAGSGAAAGCPGEGVRAAAFPYRHDGGGIMGTAIAVPRNTAATFLTHFFGRGLADDTYVVERFKALASGDIRPCSAESPGAGRRRAGAGRSAPRPR